MPRKTPNNDIYEPLSGEINMDILKERL